ncbi:MAG: extracellular solute-binding protein [Dehalococcoidia bacterium]|nr:extracellular solute-binding protein [Dehalococcoidia bacterium]MDZ4246851.1 extracellular solute-binding protein [Dehalococcoidia bacterium]
MKRVKVYSLLLVLLTALLIASCQPQATPAPVVTARPTVTAPTEKPKPAWEVEWEQAVAEAKKEGTVLIYSTPSGDIIRGLAAAFEKKYGIKVEWVNGRGEELTQRIQAEKSAGINAVDVIMSGGTTTQTVMKPRGLLGKLDVLLLLPEVTDPKAWSGDAIPYVDKDHTYIAMLATFQRYAMINTDLAKKEEITSYMDLLNPKWKGKMVINDPTVTGTGNAFFNFLAVDVWDLERTKDFMRKFVAQEPAVTRDRRLQGEWVAKGKYAISVATNMETAIEFIKLGSPVAFADVVEGGKIGAGAGGLAVPVKAGHPNASKVFVNWILSTEGHGVFVSTYGSPGSRKDFPQAGIPPEMIAKPGERAIGENEEETLHRAVMGNIAKEIFAPLLK